MPYQFFDDRRHVELDAVTSRDHEEVCRSEGEHLAVGQGLADGHVADALLLGEFLAGQRFLERGSFLVGQPPGLGGPVSQIEENEDARE